GGDVVRDAITFFQAFEGMEQGFIDRARRVQELLAADTTAFVLVASPRGDTVDEAAFFADKLRDSGLKVRALVINRMHPRFGARLTGSSGVEVARAARERARTFAGTDLGGLYANLADFEQVASREEEHVAELVAKVPDAAVVR